MQPTNNTGYIDLLVETLKPYYSREDVDTVTLMSEYYGENPVKVLEYIERETRRIFEQEGIIVDITVFLGLYAWEKHDLEQHYKQFDTE